jgi:GT2 family glycosyltransferase
VIVTSYRSRQILDACLAALSGQPAAEIVVADCSPGDPTAELQSRYPGVRVMHVPHKLTVPALRWKAVPLTRGAIVAAIEGRSVPSPDWCADLIAAHARWPDAPAIGGPVALKPAASAFDWALYFSEFAAFAPPLPDGPSAQLSGANLSYKRDALLASRDLMDAGHWEAALHERWLARGETLVLCPAAVVFHNGMRGADALRMRYHYGRSYAADRFGARRGTALIYAALTPLLPALLTLRGAGYAARKGLTARFVAALPWLVALNTAWAMGEMAGYLFGRATDAQIF